MRHAVSVGSSTALRRRPTLQHHRPGESFRGLNESFVPARHSLEERTLVAADIFSQSFVAGHPTQSPMLHPFRPQESPTISELTQ